MSTFIRFSSPAGSKSPVELNLFHFTGNPCAYGAPDDDPRKKFPVFSGNQFLDKSPNFILVKETNNDAAPPTKGYCGSADKGIRLSMRNPHLSDL